MILVTGATGRVGQQVVRTLRRLNLDVRALVRKGSEYYWLNDTGCRYFFGDLRDPESLRRACRDMRYLVVCSGVNLETRDNNHTSVTVQGHAALFEAARDRGVGRVVLISCMGVDRGYPVPSFDARRAAEELLVDSGLDYTVLRACAHEHLFLDLAWRLRDRGQLGLPGSGDNRLSPVPTRDLALMAAASLDLDALRNQVLDVGGAEVVSAREAFEAACEVVGVDAGDARILPSPVVKLGSRAGRPFRRYAHRLGEHHRWFTEDFTVDAQRMTELFGITPTPLKDAMREANATLAALRDPEEREKRMVHPQFYATVYEPGAARLADLPAGPPPRRD